MGLTFPVARKNGSRKDALPGDGSVASESEPNPPAGKRGA